jgi:hypothetical protein
MKTWLAISLTCLGLLLCVITASAELPSGLARCASAEASVLPRGVAWTLAATGSCSAACGDMGGTATVSCTGTCTIVDQDCDSGVTGYVQCQGGARADCPPCSWCTAVTPCPEGGSVSCGTWGDEEDCQGGSGLCYVKCGTQIQFCPGHFGQRFCFNG